MADLPATDSRSCWATGLWCGVVQRLIRERLAPNHPRGEYTERARRADAACVRQAVVGSPYLADAGAEALALLGVP